MAFSIRDAVSSELKKILYDFELPRWLDYETRPFRNLGSALHGRLVSQLPCANDAFTSEELTVPSQCENMGIDPCDQCTIAKYCTKSCQKQHWSRHKPDCNHPYFDPSWQPAWMTDRRTPRFMDPTGEKKPTVLQELGQYRVKLWNDYRAIDMMNLSNNEGPIAAVDQDFKICFVEEGDIRNLVKTVNSLPDDYSGRFDVLFHNINAVCGGRNLLILYVLLCSDIEPKMAAELATHLMYSAALTSPMTTYLYRCIDKIYATFTEKDPTPWLMNRRWEADFPSNGTGSGTLRVSQFAFTVERNIEILLSQFKFEAAMRSMKKVMQDPEKEDDFDRIISRLEPPHRVSFDHYRKTGVLLPFQMDTASFDQPNRTMFGANGEWLTKHSANPLYGWDVPAVLTSGLAHGATPLDLYGCLFFHVKDELLEFSTRARKFNLDITVSGVSRADELPKYICDGNLYPFKEGCFDRINLAELVDTPGESHPELIKAWAPMLKENNPHASMLLYFREWQTKTSYATASNNPAQANGHLMPVCAQSLGINLKEVAKKGANSPKFIFLLDSLDAFYDNEPAFAVYLRKINIRQMAQSAGLKMREHHRIHPKRYSVPPEAKTPLQRRMDFYELFTLSGADPTMRFLEFEIA